MQKQKLIVYVDSALVAAYGMLANAFGTTRSRVHRLGLEHGLESARAAMEAEHASQALSRRKVPVSPLLPESGQAAPAPSACLFTIGEEWALRWAQPSGAPGKAPPGRRLVGPCPPQAVEGP